MFVHINIWKFFCNNILVYYFSGKIYASEDLFQKENSNTTSVKREVIEYTPTFDLPISDEIKALCKNNVNCESDAALSGLKQIGLSTATAVKQAEVSRTVACKFQGIIQVNF